MTAKEMFEKLGYKIVENNNSRITYTIKSTDNEITFWLEYKSYVLEHNELLTNELLKAINKQVEELGWNE